MVFCTLIGLGPCYDTDVQQKRRNGNKIGGGGGGQRVCPNKFSVLYIHIPQDWGGGGQPPPPPPPVPMPMCLAHVMIQMLDPCHDQQAKT